MYAIWDPQSLAVRKNEIISERGVQQQIFDASKIILRLEKKGISTIAKFRSTKLSGSSTSPVGNLIAPVNANCQLFVFKY